MLKKLTDNNLNCIQSDADSECFCLHAPDGTFLYASEVCQQIFGTRPEYLPGRSLYDYLRPNDAARLATLLQTCLHQMTSSTSCQVRLLRGGEETLWLHVKMWPILDADGEMIQFGTESRLVPEEALPQEPRRSLASAQHRLVWRATVTEAAPDTLNWDLAFDDEEALGSLGLRVDEGETLTSAWWASRPQDDQLRCLALAKSRIRANQNFYNEFRCRMQDDSLRWFAEDVTVERLNERTWKLVASIMDVTQYKVPDSQINSDYDFVVWKGLAWKDQEDRVRWDFALPDAGVLQRFFPVEVPPDSSYILAFSACISPEDRLRKDEYGLMQLMAGRSYSQKFRCRRGDNAVRWIYEHVHVETIGPDRWKLIGFWSDITERKQHDSTLEYMLSEAQCLIWYADVEEDATGNLIWNAPFLDEAAALRFLPIHVPAGCRPIVALYRSRVGTDTLHTEDYCFNEIRAGRSYQQEYSCRCANGDIRRIAEHVNVERVATNRWKAVGVCTDITQRYLAELQVHQQVNRLAALNYTNSMIAASLDLGHTLSLVLEHVVVSLSVDAADILLFNPQTETLTCAGGEGFHNPDWSNFSLRLGKGLAGRVAQSRTAIYLPDCRREEELARLVQQLFSEEGFQAYAAIPLLAKGQMVGVLEIFHRCPLTMDSEWHLFAETMASQAAIAIDMATLFEKVQNSNAALLHAYNVTIEGWSRALDLRDKETEGHSQRVTEMTLRLARMLGIPDAELTPMRYGALLHDIGKMGIPDSILLKPGALSAEEWVIMRKHPEYAYTMLSPIQFLHPALDIPYCHHEKWDGSGYPRGLKGEAIPLAARIFAVVDVWDALCHDRPYRRALPTEQVREHIKSLAGTHLDPAIVEAFLKLEGI